MVSAPSWFSRRVVSKTAHSMQRETGGASTHPARRFPLARCRTAGGRRRRAGPAPCCRGWANGEQVALAPEATATSEPTSSSRLLRPASPGPPRRCGTLAAGPSVRWRAADGWRVARVENGARRTRRHPGVRAGRRRRRRDRGGERGASILPRGASAREDPALHGPAVGRTPRAVCDCTCLRRAWRCGAARRSRPGARSLRQ